MDTPNPGSPEAIDLGCTCPVLDNQHGKGSGLKDSMGKPLFWYTKGCPVHTVKPQVRFFEFEEHTNEVYGK